MGETIFDPTAVWARAGEVVAELSSPGKMIAVEGPAGSGRSSLVDRVAEQLPNAVVVRVPAGDDADAPLHALLQAASHLGWSYVADAADGATPLGDRSRIVLRELAQRGTCLVLLLPDRLGGSEIADDDPTKHWVERLARAIRLEDRLSFALVAPSRTLDRFEAPAVFKRFSLCAAGANLDALESAPLWGVFAGYAKRLRAELGNHPRSLGPLQLRLMVGLIALGVPVATIVQAVPGNSAVSLAALLSLYVEELRRDHRRETRAAVRRFLLPRVALDTSEDALAIAAESTDEGNALLRYCLSYGDSRLRTPPYVRNTLLQRLAQTGDEASTHHEIAKLHAASDGALSPEEAARKSRPQLDHWLEKVHHLAHSGDLGAEDWSKQSLKSREFLIDRARGLSIEQHEYREAAKLYERCLALWPSDGYALHYRGFNLDRAGEDAPTVEECYRAALVEDRANLYYNSRLVTFLVAQGRPLDAEKAWREALDNVASRSPQEIAYDMTLHVVGAWLDAGDIRRAREAFDTIAPAEEIAWDRPLVRLQQRLLDAEEAEALGVGVYPSSFPMDKRWTHPRFAQPFSSGAPRTAWYPGRVVSVEDGHVVFTWVKPTVDLRDRQVFAREVTHEKWHELTGLAPSEALTFIEIAEYQGLSAPIVFVDPSA